MILVPDGIETTNPGSVPRHDVVDSRWAAIDWTLARALGTARFWWIALSYFCGTFVWYAVQVHQTKYLIEIGVSPNAAAWALGAVSLVAVPGQIALGHLSDRIGREWVWTIGNGGFILCCVALILLHSSPLPLLLYLMVIAQGLPGVQHLWLLAFEADAPDTGETEQSLPDWVRMPSGPRARREGDDRATEP